MRSIGIEYDGFVWRKYPNSKRRSDRVYYKKLFIKNGKKTPVWLHRYIWEKANGEIPKGFVIHHRDGNPENNALDNLVCITQKEHSKAHPWTVDRIESQKIHLEKIRSLTKAWHSSPEGIAKHSEIGGQAHRNFEPHEKECKNCGKSFFPHALGNRDEFCSNSYKSAWRRKQGLDNIECTCAWCGKKFMHNKFKIPETCGRSCANHLMWKRRRAKSI